MALWAKCCSGWPAAAVLAAGCNLITGAGDLELVRKVKHDSSTSGDPQGGQGPGGSASGGWGGTAAGGYGGSTSTSSSSSGEPPPPPCEYPPGPYGTQLYDTAPPSYSWNGYPEGPVGQLASISLADYYDCDGSKGINAVMVESSQYG